MEHPFVTDRNLDDRISTLARRARPGHGMARGLLIIRLVLLPALGCGGWSSGQDDADCGVTEPDAAPVPDSSEMACDGLDDDMDGAIDEDFDFDGDGQVRCCQAGEFFATYQPGFDNIDANIYDPATGTFVRDPAIAGGLPGEEIRMNPMADFDNDGTDELLWYGATSHERYATSCQVSQGVTQGEWVTRSWGSWSLNNGSYGTGGDVDNDGCVDLVGWLQTRSPSNLVDSVEGFTALGNCDGTFNELASTFTAPILQGEWAAGYHYNLSDVDGDGFSDLVIYSYAHGGAATAKPYYLPGLGTGYFGTAVPLAVSVNQPQNSGDLGDIDNDGTIDLVGGSDDDGDKGLVMAWHDLPGLALPTPLVDNCSTVPPCSGSGPHGSGASRLYDWDQDNDLELLTSHYPDVPGAEIHFWENDGTGAFSSAGAPDGIVVPASQLESAGFMTPLRIRTHETAAAR